MTTITASKKRFFSGDIAIISLAFIKDFRDAECVASRDKSNSVNDAQVQVKMDNISYPIAILFN